jgi:hypothetical protein
LTTLAGPKNSLSSSDAEEKTFLLFSGWFLSQEVNLLFLIIEFSPKMVEEWMVGTHGSIKSRQ